MSTAQTLKRTLAGMALGGLLAAQPAFADDYIYKGDCARAELVKQERTVDKLLPYNKYMGIQRVQFGSDSCGRETIVSFNLSLKQRSTSSVVFNVRRVDLKQNSTSGQCTDPQPRTYSSTGTATMTLKMAKNGGICELYLWSDWTDVSDSSKTTTTFSNRLVWLNSFSFTNVQIAPTTTKYFTPLSFTGALTQ